MGSIDPVILTDVAPIVLDASGALNELLSGMAGTIIRFALMVLIMALGVFALVSLGVGGLKAFSKQSAAEAGKFFGLFLLLLVLAGAIAVGPSMLEQLGWVGAQHIEPIDAMYLLPVGR